jgi:hypothetical protein
MNLEIAAAALLDELGKIAADLSAGARAKIAPQTFALSAKQSDSGQPAYPIEDRHHAANALSRVAQNGSTAEKAEVYRDVAKKYPALARRSDVPALRAKAAATAMHKFLEGMGEEALPVAGALVGSGVGKMLGANQLATSAAGYGLGGLSDIALRKAIARRSAPHA